MKTKYAIRIFILSLMVGFISTFSSFAASPAAVTAKNIQQKFTKVFQNTEDRQNVPTEGIVLVVFTVTDEGKLEIKKLESTNEEASNYVIKKISAIPCQDNVYPTNHLYRVRFHFDEN